MNPSDPSSPPPDSIEREFTPRRMRTKHCVHRPFKRGKTTAGRARFSNREEAVDPFFSQEQMDERFALFRNRKFESCKHLDLEWFLRNNFVFPQILLQQNLEKFCTLGGNVYPKLVCEFFANLTKRDNELVTEVKGKRIWVNHETLLEVAGLQNSGLTFAEMMKEKWIGFRTAITFTKCVHPKKSYDGNQMKVSLMTVNHRLLHYVIVYILLPRLHNRAQPSDEDLRIIYAFKNKIQINWADFILMHINRRLNNPSGALPYPVLISRIIEHARIDVSCEEKSVMRNRADIIGKATIHKMQIRKFNGIWKWIEDAEPGEQQDDEEGSEEAEHSQQASPSSNASLKDLLDQLQVFVSSQISLVQSEVDKTNRNIQALKDRLDFGITQMESLGGNKKKDPSFSKSI